MKMHIFNLNTSIFVDLIFFIYKIGSSVR